MPWLFATSLHGASPKAKDHLTRDSNDMSWLWNATWWHLEGQENAMRRAPVDSVTPSDD